MGKSAGERQYQGAYTTNHMIPEEPTRPANPQLTSILSTVFSCFIVVTIICPASVELVA